MLYDGAIRFATQLTMRCRPKRSSRRTICLPVPNASSWRCRTACVPRSPRMSASRWPRSHLFVYRRLIEANVNKDMTALDESIQILNHMRETWILLMERLRQERSTASAPGPQTQGDPDAVAVGGFGAGRITRLVLTTSPRSSYIVRVIQRCTHRARDTECLMTRMPAVLLITTLAVTAVTAADTFAPAGDPPGGRKPRASPSLRPNSGWPKAIRRRPAEIMPRPPMPTARRSPLMPVT